MKAAWRGRSLLRIPFVTREESSVLSNEVTLVEALRQLAARCREALGLSSLPQAVDAPYTVQPGDRVLHITAPGEVVLGTPTPGRELRIKAIVTGVLLVGPSDDADQIALRTWASRTLIGDGQKWCIH